MGTPELSSEGLRRLHPLTGRRAKWAVGSSRQRAPGCAEPVVPGAWARKGLAGSSCVLQAQGPHAGCPGGGARPTSCHLEDARGPGVGRDAGSQARAGGAARPLQAHLLERVLTFTDVCQDFPRAKGHFIITKAMRRRGPRCCVCSRAKTRYCTRSCAGGINSHDFPSRGPGS